MPATSCVSHLAKLCEIFCADCWGSVASNAGSTLKIRGRGVFEMRAPIRSSGFQKKKG